MKHILEYNENRKLDQLAMETNLDDCCSEINCLEGFQLDSHFLALKKAFKKYVIYVPLTCAKF